MRVRILVIALILSTALSLAAQTPKPSSEVASVERKVPRFVATAPAAQQSEPSFEVASVKENKSGEDHWRFSAGLMKDAEGGYRAAVGTAVIANAPLREIIARAYGIEVGMERFTLFGEQPILDRRFDITAQPPPNELLGARVAMLRSLLGDRFKLKVRTESRRMPVYAVVRAHKNRLGPNMRPSAYDCVEYRRRAEPGAPPLRDANGELLCVGNLPARWPGMVGMRAASRIDVLVRNIQYVFDLPLVDGTDLDGSFDWTLTWGGRKDGLFVPIGDALEQQLGLKTEKQSAQRDVFVIESVEMPTPN